MSFSQKDMTLPEFIYKHEEARETRQEDFFFFLISFSFSLLEKGQVANVPNPELGLDIPLPLPETEVIRPQN
jgi:hypothetical protein